MIHVLYWTLVVACILYGGFRLTHIKTLQCKRCGEIVPVNEYRMHDFRCKQR